MKKLFLQLLLIIPFILFGVYSYAQTDPNLVISSSPPYWKFQQHMWQLGYHQRPQSTEIYAGIIVLMFIASVVAVRKLSKLALFPFFLSVVLILIFAYPALSHDLFNYMFNAKMVTVYHANPHQHVALEFPSDDWLRFMHNTHTPAPYGYGWTVLSLLPYAFGMNKFNPTYYLFKTFMVVGLFGLFYVQKRIAVLLKEEKQWSISRWLFFLSPLVLIETIGNAHNDVWMIALALGSMWMAFLSLKQKKMMMWIAYAVSSLAFLAASISIKFATIVLLPVVVILMFSSRVKNKMIAIITRYWADISAVLLFLPLLTERSQQFHPWYLIWSLAFVPFMQKTWLKVWILAFSLSSMFRYVPFLYYGEYTPRELQQELLITWAGGIGVFVVWGLVRKFSVASHK